MRGSRFFFSARIFRNHRKFRLGTSYARYDLHMYSWDHNVRKSYQLQLLKIWPLPSVRKNSGGGGSRIYLQYQKTWEGVPNLRLGRGVRSLRLERGSLHSIFSVRPEGVEFSEVTENAELGPLTHVMTYIWIVDIISYVRGPNSKFSMTSENSGTLTHVFEDSGGRGLQSPQIRA